MRVAVLDNGIGELASSCMIHHYRVQDDDILLNNEQISDATHGSICAKIILEFGAVDEMYDIEYLDNKGCGTIHDLCTALRFCEAQRVDVVNLSCGVVSFDKYDPNLGELIRLCKRVSTTAVIFAAQSNDALITIPADFPYVKSVELFSIHRFSPHRFRYSDYYIPKKSFRSISNRLHINVEECNSYACAFACAEYTSGKLPMNGWKSLFLKGYNGYSTTAGFVFQENVKSINNILPCAEYRIHEKVYHVADAIPWFRKIQYVLHKEYYYDINLHNRLKLRWIKEERMTLPVLIISGIAKPVDVVKRCLVNSLLTDGYIPILLSASRNGLCRFEHYVKQAYLKTALYEIERESIADIVIYTEENSYSVFIQDGLHIIVHDSDYIELVREGIKKICTVSEIYQQVLELYGE